jgi:hypothetical protein
MVDYWIIHHPPLDFHGAGGRGRRPWLCEHAPLSGTGVDGPQAEERAIAADAHRIARVPCDEFLFFVFLAEALKKNTVCPVVKKRSRQIAKCMFLFEQSYKPSAYRPQTSCGAKLNRRAYLGLYRGACHPCCTCDSHWCCVSVESRSEFCIAGKTSRSEPSSGLAQMSP